MRSKASEKSKKHLLTYLLTYLLIYLLNPLRALWHIRPTQDIANRPCFAPSVQPGPKVIHSPSFFVRMIFSMSPLVFRICVYLHLVSILMQSLELHRTAF